VNITVENLAPCRKLLRVEIESDAVDNTFKEVTTRFQREARLPGFRPGKAPREMVARTYAKEIEEEVKRKLISDNYRKAINEKKIAAVTYPDIEEIQFGRGQNLQFAATVETAPEFELPDYKGIPVKVQPAVVSEADLERAFQALREQQASYNDVVRPVQQGDYVVINYKGTTEGKPLTELAPTARGLTEQNNFWVRVDTDSFIPGFTEQLIGASAGEKRTITVEFPKDFIAPQLSGRQGVYEVEVVQVKERVLPEVTDAFAKSYGAENLEQLREGVRADLQRELDLKRRREIRNQIATQLLQKVQIELPESVVQNETRNVIHDIIRDNHERGISRDQIEKQKQEIFNVASNSAKDRLKAGFLLSRIGEKEQIKVTTEEIASRVAALAEQYKIPFQKMARQLEERGGVGEIQEQILIGKVFEFLEKQAAIEEAPATAP